MKIDYTRFTVTKNGKAVVLLKPLVDVGLMYNNTYTNFDILAMVDSGADHCLFNSDYGDDIGINVYSVIPYPIYGISGKEVKVYFHNVSIVFDGRELPTLCGFVDRLEIAVLGYKGFFDRYKITFDANPF